MAFYHSTIAFNSSIIQNDLTSSAALNHTYLLSKLAQSQAKSNYLTLGYYQQRCNAYQWSDSNNNWQPEVTVFPVFPPISIIIGFWSYAFPQLQCWNANIEMGTVKRVKLPWKALSDCHPGDSN